jgi:hypothetical protein
MKQLVHMRLFHTFLLNVPEVEAGCGKAPMRKPAARGWEKLTKQRLLLAAWRLAG